MEAAVATRGRLHGTKWPSTNPKLLAVDFLSAEEALKLTEGELVVGKELLQAGEPKEMAADVEEAKKESKESNDKEEVVKEPAQSKEIDGK